MSRPRASRPRAEQAGRLLLLLPIVVATGTRALSRAASGWRRQRAETNGAGEQVVESGHEVVPAPTAAVRIARRMLVALGVAGLLVAARITVTEVHPRQYGGMLLWLVAAIVLHDGVLAPIVFSANRLLRGAGARVPAVVLAILQAAVVVGVIFTLVVVPEIRAQQLGVRNPTVLPEDYALHLAVLWAVLAVLAALASGIALAVRRRRGVPLPH